MNCLGNLLKHRWGAHPKAREAEPPGWSSVTCTFKSFPRHSDALQSLWRLRSPTDLQKRLCQSHSRQMKAPSDRKVSTIDWALIQYQLTYIQVPYTLFSLNSHRNSLEERLVSTLQRKLRLRKMVHLLKRNWWCRDSQQDLLSSKLCLWHQAASSPPPLPRPLSGHLGVPCRSQMPTSKLVLVPDDGVTRPRRSGKDKVIQLFSLS